MSESWCIRMRHLCSDLHALPAAMLEMGALLGALLAGVLADRYSRNRSILVACGESTIHIWGFLATFV